MYTNLIKFIEAHDVPCYEAAQIIDLLEHDTNITSSAHGDDRRVYLIGSYAIKLNTGCSCSENENEVELYENDSLVKYLHDRLTPIYYHSEDFRFIIMERMIETVTDRHYASNYSMTDKCFLYYKQLEKVANLYDLCDMHISNAMYDKSGKLYLVDYADWGG